MPTGRNAAFTRTKATLITNILFSHRASITDYDAIGVHDIGQQQALMANFPAAFKPGSEHLTLKAKVENFEGGLFA